MNSKSSPKNHWWRLTNRTATKASTRVIAWADAARRPMLTERRRRGRVTGPLSRDSSSPPSAGRTAPATLRAIALDDALLQRLADPGDHLVEHGVERCGRFDAEHPLGLVGSGDAALHVVLERRVR